MVNVMYPFSVPDGVDARLLARLVTTIYRNLQGLL